MPLYQVSVRQRYADQLCINVFHYLMTGTPASVSGSFALISAMGFIAESTIPPYPAAALFSGWRDLVSIGVHFTEIEAEALYSPTDFYLAPLTNDPVGRVTGEAMSPIQAFGFYSNRVTKAVRRGFKRLVGVPETFVGDLGVLTGTASDWAESVAAWFSAPLSYDDEGNTLTFTPVVLSYEKYTTDSGRTAYRPYSSEAVQLTHMAAGVLYTPYPQVRSQTSRQYGRGA